MGFCMFGDCDVMGWSEIVEEGEIGRWACLLLCHESIAAGRVFDLLGCAVVGLLVLS